MSNELLTVDPVHLSFPFELKKRNPCSLYLGNKTDNFVAFKFKTTNRKCRVTPSIGVVHPRSSSQILVTSQAQMEAPADMQCNDWLLLQCVVTSPGASCLDVTHEMFSEESGNRVEETKLRVTYVAPQGSEEGSSSRASVSDYGNTFGFTAASRYSRNRFEPQDSSEAPRYSRNRFEPQDYSQAPGYSWNRFEPQDGSEARALIEILTVEKDNYVQLRDRLQKELDKLKRQDEQRRKRLQSGKNESRGGVPFMYVILVGLIGYFLEIRYGKGMIGLFDKILRKSQSA